MKLLKVESDKHWSSINGVPVRFHRLHLREHAADLEAWQVMGSPASCYNATPYGGIEAGHLMHEGANGNRVGEGWEIVVTLRESPLKSYAETIKFLVDGAVQDSGKCAYKAAEFLDSLPSCPAFEPAEPMPRIVSLGERNSDEVCPA